MRLLIGVLGVSLFLLAFLSPVSKTLAQEGGKQIDVKEKEGVLMVDKSTRYAMIIGINNYQDPAISSLKYAEDDAQALYSVLISDRGGFRKENVFLFLPGSAEATLVPTRFNIKTKLRFLSELIKDGDTLLFFFSGHGGQDNDGENYVYPVEASTENLSDTGINVKDVYGTLEKSSFRRKILILDACRGRVGGKGLAEMWNASAYIESKGIVSFYSAEQGQKSWEDDKLKRGAFSYLLVQGLKGSADKDRDVIVSADELENYLDENMRKWSIDNSKRQIPWVKKETGGGRIPIVIGPIPMLRVVVPSGIVTVETGGRRLLSIQVYADSRLLSDADTPLVDWELANPEAGSLTPAGFLSAEFTPKTPGTYPELIKVTVTHRGAMSVGYVSIEIPGPITLPKGKLTLALSPPTATYKVLRGGKDVLSGTGILPETELEPGTYTLVVSAPGYSDETQTVEITSDVLLPKEIILKKLLGLLTITAEPANAKIKITKDGRLVESAAGPLSEKSLDPGEYEITVSAEGYQPITEKVTVLTSGTTTRYYELQPAPRKIKIRIAAPDFKDKVKKGDLPYYGVSLLIDGKLIVSTPFATFSEESEDITVFDDLLTPGTHKISFRGYGITSFGRYVKITEVTAEITVGAKPVSSIVATVDLKSTSHIINNSDWEITIKAE